MDRQISHECDFDFSFLYFSSFLDNEYWASWLFTASRPWLLRVTDLMMHLFHSVALERLPFNETMFGVTGVLDLLLPISDIWCTI
jgi:hypothetical protein